MRSTEELFSNKDSVGSFHDCVFDALDLHDWAEGYLSDMFLMQAFISLPLHIRMTAFEWGLSDTVFRDEAYVYIEKHADTYLQSPLINLKV
jgi:hypothetical protein